MPRNDAAAPDHVCPGIRIHVIDIVQPPGIGISPIDDIDVHQTIVTTALADEEQRREAPEHGTFVSQRSARARLPRIQIDADW